MSFWLRPFLFLDLHTSRLARLLRMIRDELLWAFLAPEKRSDLNAWIYARDKRYLPGGLFFEEGLFDWEREAFKKSPFPKSGTILLGGAGAGREVSALRKRGYRVIAFEILPDLASQGQEIFVGSYSDLFKDGSLTKIIQKESYDAVILGWGSFSNIVDAGKRQALLGKVKELAPKAPLFLSFLSVSTLPAGKIDRFRLTVRGMLRWLGAQQTASAGDIFLSTAGFAHTFSPEEVRTLAENAGYRVALGSLSPYPHVLLTPLS